jgi:hypothetical protein
MNNQFDELTKNLARPVSPGRPLKQFCVGLAGMTLACFALANQAEAADPPYATRKQAETMQQQQPIIANGVFPLTQEAADAGLDAIEFIAAAVRGYNSIHVTGNVRPLWRARLAYWYPQLPAVTQRWYANAPQMLASMRAQWPLLDPWSRAAWLNQWTMELPSMLSMVEPVLAQAQAVEMQQSQRPQIEHWQAKATQPTLTDSQAVNQLNSNMRSADRLGSFNTSMTTSTINLMNAMSGR